MICCYTYIFKHTLILLKTNCKFLSHESHANEMKRFCTTFFNLLMLSRKAMASDTQTADTLGAKSYV